MAKTGTDGFDFTFEKSTLLPFDNLVQFTSDFILISL